MKLNDNGKNELRKKIEEETKNVPKGQKIHLEKDLLENLLFETFTYNKSTNAIVKIPVWSGKFLQKIDLSEVSFEDVSWTLHSDYWNEEKYRAYIDEDVFEKILTISSGYVYYGYTNAKIDLKKSFEFKTTGQIELFECDFEGIDLSSNDMSSLYCADECDLSNTKIVLSPEMLKGKKHSTYVFWDSNLQNVDLSKFTVDASDMVDECLGGFFNNGCCLTNTNLNILLDTTSESWINYKNRFPDSVKESIQTLMSHVGGCYINGKRVLTEEEQNKLKEEKIKEYEAYKQQIIDLVSSDIQTQINDRHK